MIEHVPFSSGRRMIAECYRVLKPGGRIRIANAKPRTDCRPQNADTVGGAAAVCQLGHGESRIGRARTDRRENRYRPASVINNFFWDFGHYFVYDLDTLVATLSAAGFLDAVACTPGDSAVPD